MNWQQLDPARVERGVQLLLRQLYPNLRSFDGSGGDGGRDAELVSSDGHIAFEVKSFTRIGSSQRRQIERSLRSAVESLPEMTRWVLVVPANMTPRRPGSPSSEEAWFRGRLASFAPGVELEWRGLDWLDARMAEHPEYQRYIEGADSQLLQRVRLFGQEKAVLAGGATDLHERLKGLRGRVDEISPFWTLDFRAYGNVTESVLRAKVPNAHLLDPIRITPTFSFDPANPADVKLRATVYRTLGFGGTVNLPAGRVTGLDVDASDEVRALLGFGDPSNDQFTIRTHRVPLERTMRCSYQVLGPDDTILDQFSVFLRERTAGSVGITLYGSDAADIATFTVVVPRPRRLPGPDESLTMGDADLGLALPSVVGHDIESLLPIARTLAHASPGNRLRFVMPGLGHITSEVLDSVLFEEAAITRDIAEDLHQIQQITGTSFLFPAGVTTGDVVELRNAVRTLNGETVDHEGGLTLTLRADAVEDFLATLDSGDGGKPGALMYSAELVEIQVGDLTIQYGPAAFYAPLPRLTNRTDLEASLLAPPETAGVQAIFEPSEFPFKWLSRDQAKEHLEGRESD